MTQYIIPITKLVFLEFLKLISSLVMSWLIELLQADKERIKLLVERMSGVFSPGKSGTAF